MRRKTQIGFSLLMSLLLLVVAWWGIFGSFEVLFDRATLRALSAECGYKVWWVSVHRNRAGQIESIVLQRWGGSETRYFGERIR
jgi:hypothetical protein